MVSHTISSRPSSHDGGSMDGHVAPGPGHVAPAGHTSPGSSGVQVELQISVSLMEARMTMMAPTPKDRISITASVRTTVLGCMGSAPRERAAGSGAEAGCPALLQQLRLLRLRREPLWRLSSGASGASSR